MPNGLPLLIFPEPARVHRASQHGGPGRVTFPTSHRQGRRLTPKFNALRHALETEAARVRAIPQGLEPELALVLETIGSVAEFKRAVDRIEGLEWLLEWDEEEIPPDEDFFDELHPDKPLSGRLFLVMASQRGIDELLRLWRIYVRDESVRFPLGQGRLKYVFRQLRDVRRWGVQDRLEETGVLQYWAEFLSNRATDVICEAELWFRSGENHRNRAYENLRLTVVSAGGQCLSSAVIPQIAYHAAVLRLPATEVRRVLDREETQLVRLNDVVFFRPVGQSAAPMPDDRASETAPTRPSQPLPSGEPVVALLDGLPQANHPLLAGRLAVDDPDGWASSYQAQEMWHGTTMASLLIHGDLNAGENALPRPIYARPIMKPNPVDWRRPREECIPYECLQTDLLYRAVRRILQGEGQEAPAAPSVRIINISVCDPSQPLFQAVSPMGRLFDWLAWEHKVLFVVSAGNHPEDVVLSVPRQGLSALTPGQLQDETLKAIARDVRNRRVLAPADGMNVLTVAGIHDDKSQPRPGDRRVNPHVQSGLPCTYNALGYGFRRSVKPEIMVPSGRLFLIEKPGSSHQNATLQASPSPAPSPPGQLAAAPGATTAGIPPSSYTRGTSNAAALVSRYASLLFDQISALRNQPGGVLLDDTFVGVLIRALLVHGASWGAVYGTLEQALRTPENSRRFAEYVSRFLGYGQVDPDRVMSCTSQRATLIGCSRLRDSEGHIFRVPLPPSLSGQRAWKRLIVTLSWFTPINPVHRSYRRAHLWFGTPEHGLMLDRDEADWKAVQRGTVQHEIFMGERADAFADGDSIQVQVNCRADAGELDEAVPYAVAVTLEVAPNLTIPVYDEIRARIQVPVAIQPE